MRDFIKLSKVVKDTLAGAFHRIRVLDVDIEDDMDTSGDEFLRINIIYEGGKLNTKEVAAAVSLLHDRLSKVPEIAFPVLSFISQSDIERHKRASK